MFAALESLRGASQDVLHALRSGDARAPYLDLLRHTPGFARLLPALARTLAGQTLVHAAAGQARKRPNALALWMDDERWTWGDLERVVSGLAHVLDDEGIERGHVVALIAKNSPAYLAMVLALGRVGATAALVNPALTQGSTAPTTSVSPLEHAVRAASAVRIVAAEPLSLLQASESLLLDDLLARARAVTRPTYPLRRVRQDEDFVYIYTSGTTGLPKPCRVGHSRATMAGAAAAQLGYRFEPRNDELLYCVLPLFHANALLLGAGASIMSGTPMAIRDGFSARHFWPDVQRYRATAFNYIGELGRYIAESEYEPSGPHTLRVAFGNGLRPAAWATLKERFGIAAIREFYAATESPGGLINFSERPGSIGHLPLRQIGWLRLARYDVESGELVRDERGFLIECDEGEAGELLVRMSSARGGLIGDATKFRGYTDENATRAKVLENCFRQGDRYFRSGDLLRYDENDFFYFVDRLGDTYRWKGENVSTQEVTNLFTSPALKSIAVVGVEVPGQEGRAGLAAIIPAIEVSACVETMASIECPAAARPRFLRIVAATDATPTHKTKTALLRKEGADPSRVLDPLYYFDGQSYRPLNALAWAQICAGEIRI
ncbi:MAG: AMP-binding protein [Polyangiales bacterium]